MKAAAAVSISGLIGLILLEVLRVVLTPVLIWAFGILVVVVKFLLIAVAILLAVSAIAGTVFVVRKVRGSRTASV